MTVAQKHIVMIPVAAYGHITPLLELAKRLYEQHRITFVIPEFLLEDVRKRGYVIKSENFVLKALPDGFIPDPSIEKGSIQNMEKLMMAYIPKLLMYVMGLQKSESSTVSESHIDTLIIDDLLAGFGTPISRKGIPVFQYNTSAAGGMLLKGLCMDEDAPVWEDDHGRWPTWDSAENGLQALPVVERMIYIRMKENIPNATGFIVNSEEELEAAALEKIRSHPLMADKRVFMVGPLMSKIESADTSPTSEKVKAWLAQQDPRSVVYFALGTVALPHNEQVVEIANGLLQSGRPFIWSLPASLNQLLPAELKDSIATQFETPGAKHLVLPWAPQRLILDHGSTGLFVSHCGWNSTLETLTYGVPVLAWPMFADQGVNAKLLAKHGVADIVEGTGMKWERTVPAEEISMLIAKVSNNSCFAEEAKRWSSVLEAAVLPGGESEKQLQELLSML